MNAFNLLISLFDKFSDLIKNERIQFGDFLMNELFDLTTQ